MSDKTLQMAQALRGWEEENPWKSIGLGFVPVAGQAYGMASAAAAYRDPDASTLDKALATVGMIPFGGKSLQKAIGGPILRKRAEQLGLEIPDWAKADDGRFYHPEPEVTAESYWDALSEGDKGARGKGWHPQNEDKDNEAFMHHLFDRSTPANAKRADDYTDLIPETINNKVALDHYGPANWGTTVEDGSLIKVGGDSAYDLGGLTDEGYEAFEEFAESKDTLFHELQHSIQRNVEKYPEGRIGTNGSGVDYYGDMGEMEARLNAAYSTDKIPQGFPLQQALDNQKKYIDLLRDTGRSFDQQEELNTVLGLMNK